jgi:uncharacterized membrane protein
MQEEPEREPVFARTRYQRTGTGLEFDRFANFADAIYAISMTLVVVGIGVPTLTDDHSARELLDQLKHLFPNILTFFIVFFVVGSYWVAHHRFVGWLASIDTRLLHLQLLYLSVIAFLPFPAALLGTLGSNIVALAAFAVAMATASLLETVMIRQAFHASLFRDPLSLDAYRWELIASLTPVAIFIISIPLALISVWVAILFWFVNAPLGILMNRRRPPEFGGPTAH